MKTRLILLACAACFLIPVSATEKQTPLGKQMESFNDAYRAFRKEKDPAKGAALARDAQQAVIKAMGETPEMLAQMPDGPGKAKAAAEFRKMMGQVFVSLCEVEQAFLAGETAEVAEIIASLKELKKSGHDKFMEED